jgi:hypothetical protein
LRIGTGGIDESIPEDVRKGSPYAKLRNPECFQVQPVR